jgi:hypothetical protein
LLLLSVAVALAILVAGGVLLLQLANDSATVEPAEVGDVVEVGDVTAVVRAVSDSADELVVVEVEIGGVDDDIDSFRLLTGDRRLEPISAPATGRCSEITVETRTCRLEFDVSAAEGSSRVLILRRGEEQRNWSLPAP